MSVLDNRLKKLELKFITKETGCNPTLLIVIPEEMQQSFFESDTYKPAEGEIGKYLESLKDTGQCQGCKGSCAIDWDMDGFKNHAIIGASSSPSGELTVIYVVNDETAQLTRRIMAGEGTGEPR